MSELPDLPAMSEPIPFIDPFSFSVFVPRWIKIIVIALPFAFLIVDVLSWWLTKLHPNFAWLTIIGGIGYSLASLFMWAVSMYEMWILSRTGKVYGNAWEADMLAWGVDLDKEREEILKK